jgi:hypothetical protein
VCLLLASSSLIPSILFKQWWWFTICIVTRNSPCPLQYLRWSNHGWWSVQCPLGQEVWASGCQQATNGAYSSRANTSLGSTLIMAAHPCSMVVSGWFVFCSYWNWENGKVM